MKQTNEEQLQQLQTNLERLDAEYRKILNTTCAERDAAMLELDKLKEEHAAYKKALKQLLSLVMFPPPGVCWTGTGSQDMDALIEEAIKANELRMATASHKDEVFVGYVPPK